MDVPRRARVTVSEYPPDRTAEFAPRYKQKRKVLMRGQRDPNFIPIITMGRYGKLLKKARPSDDAFIAMIESAQEIIRLSLQDLGPVKLPGTSHPLPGLEWPKKTISALAKVIWDKGVDVEIVLSNPGRYVHSIFIYEYASELLDRVYCNTKRFGCVQRRVPLLDTKLPRNCQ